MTKISAFLIFVFLFLFTFSPLVAKEPQILAQVTQLSNPESALWWEEGKAWIVSNVNGNPTALDGNGFLSLISPEGVVLELSWVEGLNAPKGMALDASFLYVADIQEVHKVQLIPSTQKAERITTIPIPNALFLNDLVLIKPQLLAVSDTQGKGIFLLEKDIPRLLVKDNALGSPNGLAIDQEYILVAQFASGSGKGGLLRVHSKTGALAPSMSSLGALDGIMITKLGKIYISDFTTGKIKRIEGSEITEVWSGGKGTADFGFNPKKGHLAVPNMNKNSLTLLQLVDAD
jgi:hypothetical protein